MENSVLSDAAGVQKNISKMYEEYAQSIGKSSDSLTQSEKAQAVYNGIMAEASMFTGAAAEMANGYQGQQAQLNAINLELSRTIGESMIPALTQYSSLQLSITKGLTEFIKEHKGATSGIITFTTTLLGAVVALTTAKKAYNAYKAAASAANMTTQAFTASLLANPITLISVGIAATVAGISVFNTKMQESIEKMQEMTDVTLSATEALENFNNNGSYTETEKSAIDNKINQMQEIVDNYEKIKNEISNLEQQIEEESSKIYTDSNEKYKNIDKLREKLSLLKEALADYEKQYYANGKTNEDYLNTIKTLNTTLSIGESKQKYLTLTNQKAHRETLINIAQTKADIKGKQELLNILKQGKSATEEYKDAKNQLVKAYPELAKVNENTITSTQKAIDAENAAADAEWVNAQTAIQASILEVSAMMNNKEQILQIAFATKQSVEEVTASLQNQMAILGNLAKLSPEDFKGSVTSTYTPKISKSSSSKSYSNKRLDNYKKEIEHKKAMDQLSLQQEIKMYQKALKSYAKTTDEKRELQEKIYELQKELQEKEYNDYVANIEHKKALDQLTLQQEISMYQKALKTYAKTADQKNEIREKIYELNKELALKEKELLEQQTEDYEVYIQQQKNLRGAEYTVSEQTKDYDKIIAMHRNYLNQIMQDERLSLDERKQIYREELATIRDYEQQKRELRIDSIDNTVSQLTNAITKHLEEMQNKEKELIDKNLEAVEEWKNARIKAVNEEYDARIEAIEKELDALDKAEQEKTREEEDAEYERKRRRLEELIDFEHDATTKANYQKELNKLIEEYQNTLNKRELQDRKEALNAQKDLLQEEQDNQIQAIEDEADKQKETYEKQLEELEKYYDEQMEKAEETAQQMLLNIEKNQDQILELLKSYGDYYEITGQTFGEKLAQGFAEKAMEKVQSVIGNIQKAIDSAIENNMSRMAKASETISLGNSASGSTVINKNINVEQNNTITSPVDSPSVIYKKQETLNRALAKQIGNAI